jgi:8-oxo-dGTP diphosphatase
MPQQDMDVAVIVVYDGPRMLVNKRPEGSYFGGWWEWPGGKLNQGEDMRACALRELEEEIGIRVTGLRELEQRTVEYPGRSIRLVFYVARLAPGSRPHQAALEHLWLEPSEVLKLRFLEPNLPVLRQLAKSPPPEACGH